MIGRDKRRKRLDRQVVLSQEELAGTFVSVPTVGTPSSTTFLRGDGQWATPPGGGGGPILSTDITDATATGRSVLVAASAANARSAIGAGTASTKADVGLSNVDNTSDANKPISTATQNALNAKQSILDALKIVVWNGVLPEPARPATNAGVPVFWSSPVRPVGGGTIAGGGSSVNGLDIWLGTP